MSTGLTIALSFATPVACIAIDCLLVLLRRRAAVNSVRDQATETAP